MEKISLKIETIPAELYGTQSDKVYLFIHGKLGSKDEAIDFAKIVCPKGYQVLSIDLPEHGERKHENNSFVPWVVVPELKLVMEYLKEHWKHISLRATSLRAWFSLLSFPNEPIEQCLFVSPILDMKNLIEKMMIWATVTKNELKDRKIIHTNFNEILDWNYYEYSLANPITKWTITTNILYSEKDNLTDKYVVDEFSQKYNCGLVVMENGEHWFHTTEQLAFLDEWTDKIT